MSCLRNLVALGLVLSGLLLSACGGGGSATPEPEPVNRAPVAVASAPASVTAGSSVTLDGSASHDPDGDALRWRWTVSAQPAGAGVILSDPAQASPSFVAAVAGSYTLSLVVSDGALDSAPVTLTLVVQAADPGPLSIVLDPAEPVSGIVVFTLSGPHEGRVSWYLDLQLLGPAEGSEQATASWDSRGASLGTHLIVARLHDAQGGWREVRRNFEVGPQAVTLTARTRGSTGMLEVDVSATSPYRISSVSATIDGRPLGRLETPNGCGVSGRECAGPDYHAWLFAIDADQLGPGPHAMLITAVDGMGRSATLAHEVLVGPLLSMRTPLDGSVVYGRLEISGSVRGLPADDVQVEVTLGGMPVLSSRGSSFSGEYDLSGVAPNRYLLTVTARDGSGLVTREEYRIAIAPSPNWVRPSAFRLPRSDAQVLAARGTYVLHDAGTSELWLHDIASDQALRLRYEGFWDRLFGDRFFVSSEGTVYALGNTGDCSSQCLYRWDSAGVLHNLTAANPHSANKAAGGAAVHDGAPRTADGYALWATTGDGGNLQRLVLYDTLRNSFRLVAAEGSEIDAYDLSVRAGVATVVWSARVGGQRSLRVWRSDTGASRVLLEGDGGFVRTDGEQVVWLQVGAGSTPRLLQSMPLGGGAARVISTSVNGNSLELHEDGSLSWGESLYVNGVVHTLPADSGSGPRRVVFAVSMGWIFYVDVRQNVLYAWNAVRGVAEPMFDSNAMRGWITDGHLVFQYLTAVYRMPLNP